MQHSRIRGGSPGRYFRAPIRTFSDWNENKPGFLEADLVAHCGDSAEGFYLTTLSTVDVATASVSRWQYGARDTSEVVVPSTK